MKKCAILICNALMCFCGYAISSVDLFDKVKKAIAIVQCDSSTGSGFVLEMEDGKKFFITNKHVVFGQKRVSAFLVDGTVLQLGRFEVARNSDLVRFSVHSGCFALKQKNEVHIRENVFIFGNSDGGMVATDIGGKVLGVGPDRIEVSAKFVSGNSGSAVLNQDGEVIGVATYATLESKPSEWVKKDTRYNEVRRFALRLNNVKWERTYYNVFYSECVKRNEDRAREYGILPQVTATFSPSRMYFVPYMDDFGIYCDITLNMRTTLTSVKNPVVRVCVLVRGITGEYYMADGVFSMTGSMSHFRYSPPVYMYGGSKDGYVYNIGNNEYVYYLEGLSYHQKLFSAKKKVGIKYFDKVNDVKQHRSLFRVSKGITGEKPPDVVCYRLECWQNGSLAGEYNSLRPASLNAKKLPVDWYCRDKYKALFKYAYSRYIRCGGSD